MWKQIFKTTLVAGTMDITGACIHAYIAAKLMPAFILRYVASGFFGNAAFTGSTIMMFWGLFFHFIIAFACTACFFLLYPHLKWLHGKWLLNTFLIAIVAWAVTNLLIKPMSNVSPSVFNLSKALIACMVLVVCIGLPIARSAHNFYRNRTDTKE
jgi:hypothetical protein